MSINESQECGLDNNIDDNSKACSSEDDSSIDVTGWNSDHIMLNILTHQAGYEIEKVKFIQRWLMPHLHLNVYPGTRFLARQAIDLYNDRSVRKESELLLRFKDSAVQVQSNLASAARVVFDHAVSDIPDTFKSHCEEYAQPSNWISMASEVSWMLKQISRSWLINSDSVEEMRIALISTAKMERLGVLFDQSDLLVQRAGGKLWTRANSPGDG
ncbi:MAG: hypothetical protein Q9198_006224, partial [Flavoplaca austrocitrina]